MGATVTTIGFGKHKGTPVGEVPTDYLAWVMRTFRTPPPAVKQELQRRGNLTGPSAILAASALSDRGFRDARKKRSKRHRGRCSNETRSASRSEEQRQKSHERLARLSRGVEITGKNYERERAAWEAAGGNSRECPFTCVSAPAVEANRALHGD